METIRIGIDEGDALLRLGLAAIATGILGFDRSERGKSAGMRTTMLVGLAAAVAMILATALMTATGKAPDSFVNIDPMRLPLGILSGVGFIGGGAILRRGTGVSGVTTAATLWFVTVVGLCFGGGQLLLGVAATGLGILVLRGLAFVEGGLAQDRSARLVVEVDDAFADDGLVQRLAAEKMQIVGRHVAAAAGRRTLTFDLRQRRAPADQAVPELVGDLGRDPAVRRAEWHALTLGGGFSP
jgi:putative Mg2+ transporter-C (MgtC) family protein